jgi:hypothetical protein
MKRFVCDNCKDTVRQRRIDIINNTVITDGGYFKMDRPVVICRRCVEQHNTNRKEPGTHRATQGELWSLGR